MLDQGQRTAILELHRQGHGKRRIARALGISRATAIRHWSFARAWLYQQVRQDG